MAKASSLIMFAHATWFGMQGKKLGACPVLAKKVCGFAAMSRQFVPEGRLGGSR
jgi:hypothetical protein